MNEIIVILFSLFVSVVIVALMMCAIAYSVHISMNREDGKPIGYGTFEQFLTLFATCKWFPDDTYKSFFPVKGDREKWYVYASIIRLNGKNMILYPLDYVKFSLWKYNYFKKIKTQEAVNWNEEVKNISNNKG